MIDFLHRLRDAHPQTAVMAGNAVTSGMAKDLILDDADIVEVGIGPGLVCPCVSVHKLHNISGRTSFIRLAWRLNAVFGQS